MHGKRRNPQIVYSSTMCSGSDSSGGHRYGSVVCSLMSSLTAGSRIIRHRSECPPGRRQARHHDRPGRSCADVKLQSAINPNASAVSGWPQMPSSLANGRSNPPPIFVWGQCSARDQYETAANHDSTKEHVSIGGLIMNQASRHAARWGSIR